MVHFHGLRSRVRGQHEVAVRPEIDLRHLGPVHVQQLLAVAEEVRAEHGHLHVLGHGELLAQAADRQRGGALAIL